MREHESEQRSASREEPGVQEHKSEQRAAAREEPGVREHESEQGSASREEPGVQEHESEQRGTGESRTVVVFVPRHDIMQDSQLMRLAED